MSSELSGPVLGCMRWDEGVFFSPSGLFGLLVEGDGKSLSGLSGLFCLFGWAERETKQTRETK